MSPPLRLNTEMINGSLAGGLSSQESQFMQSEGREEADPQVRQVDPREMNKRAIRKAQFARKSRVDTGLSKKNQRMQKRMVQGNLMIGSPGQGWLNQNNQIISNLG